jgi:hypothetical protein
LLQACLRELTSRLLNTSLGWWALILDGVLLLVDQTVVLSDVVDVQVRG